MFEKMLEDYFKAVVLSEKLRVRVESCKTNNVEYIREEYVEAVDAEIALRNTLIDLFHDR